MIWCKSLFCFKMPCLPQRSARPRDTNHPARCIHPDTSCRTRPLGHTWPGPEPPCHLVQWEITMMELLMFIDAYESMTMELTRVYKCQIWTFNDDYDSAPFWCERSDPRHQVGGCWSCMPFIMSSRLSNIGCYRYLYSSTQPVSSGFESKVSNQQNG